MAHLQLSADPRSETGSRSSRRLRRAGHVPGVVYGAGSEARSFSAPDRELRRVLLGLGGRTSVIDLAVGSAPARPVLFKDWQLHPVRGDIVHVDFQQVDLTETIETYVQVVLEGTPVGVREGGVLDHSLREVGVRALPDALPDEVTIDVSGLDVGDTVTVADLVAPEGSELTTDPEIVVASVTYASQVEEPEEEEGLEELAEGEPELVGETDEESDAAE